MKEQDCAPLLGLVWGSFLHVGFVVRFGEFDHGDGEVVGVPRFGGHPQQLIGNGFEGSLHGLREDCPIGVAEKPVGCCQDPPAVEGGGCGVNLDGMEPRIASQRLSLYTCLCEVGSLLLWLV